MRSGRASTPMQWPSRRPSTASEWPWACAPMWRTTSHPAASSRPSRSPCPRAMPGIWSIGRFARTIRASRRFAAGCAGRSNASRHALLACIANALQDRCVRWMHPVKLCPELMPPRQEQGHVNALLPLVVEIANLVDAELHADDLIARFNRLTGLDYDSFAFHEIEGAMDIEQFTRIALAGRSSKKRHQRRGIIGDHRAAIQRWRL